MGLSYYGRDTTLRRLGLSEASTAYTYIEERSQSPAVFGDPRPVLTCVEDLTPGFRCLEHNAAARLEPPWDKKIRSACLGPNRDMLCKPKELKQVWPQSLVAAPRPPIPRPSGKPNAPAFPAPFNARARPMSSPVDHTIPNS